MNGTRICETRMVIPRLGGKEEDTSHLSEKNKSIQISLLILKNVFDKNLQYQEKYVINI